MGAKSTKIFKTPDSIKKKLNAACDRIELRDPRSPDVLRTPLNELNTYTEQLKDANSFRDPRSPSSCVTRTPIVFDSDQSKSFVFEEEDTFSELFTSNPDPKSKAAKNEVKGLDPRSPSSDIDRTPLVFDDGDNINLELPPIVLSDEDEENEEEIIQSVLDMLQMDDENEKPKNKQIEKVKNMHKKTNIKTDNNKPKIERPIIYQDSNVFYSTPKRINLKDKEITEIKRTPLGCVENKLCFRSGSVENLKNKNGKSFGRNFNESSFKQIKSVSAYEDENSNSSFII